jgi:hypothetical protein
MSGQSVDFLIESLPADGVYNVQVRAASAQPNATGSYRVSVHAANIDVSPLVRNQTTLGLIETPYSIDRWTFTADANQQVRFDLINSGVNQFQFKLSGPNGFVGFAELSDDSDPVTLTETGVYTLEVTSKGDVGSYSFQVNDLVVTDLVGGVPFAATIAGSGYARLFRIDLPQPGPLAVQLDDTSNANRNEIYLRRGAAPTRQIFDQRSTIPGADQSLLVPLAAAGQWYILLYSNLAPIPSDYTIRAVTSPVFVSRITPEQIGGGGSVPFTVTGAGFVNGTQLELVDSTSTVFPIANVHVDAADRLSATVNLATMSVGAYDVRVKLPGGAMDVLPAAFHITSAGQPFLTTRLIMPTVLGRQATGTIYL